MGYLGALYSTTNVNHSVACDIFLSVIFPIKNMQAIRTLTSTDLPPEYWSIFNSSQNRLWGFPLCYLYRVSSVRSFK